MSAHAFALTSTRPAVLKNLRILVVEDEALIAMLVEDALLEAGAKVLVAASVADALRLVDMAAADGGLSVRWLATATRRATNRCPGEALSPTRWRWNPR
jgi:hypothetical protein